VSGGLWQAISNRSTNETNNGKERTCLAESNGGPSCSPNTTCWLDCPRAPFAALAYFVPPDPLGRVERAYFRLPLRRLSYSTL